MLLISFRPFLWRCRALQGFHPLIVFFFLFLFSAHTVSAAELRCVSMVPATSIDQLVRISVVFDAKGESINALGGSLVISPELVPLDVIDSPAIGGLWIHQPTVSDLSFSKMIPGGYRGKGDELFAVVLQAKAVGSGRVTFLQPEAYLNDATSTAARMTSSSCDIAVAKTGYLTVLPPVVNDLDPPAPFVPVVGRQESLFENRFFVVFSATDVGSGIDHYELSEGGRAFHAVTSPYVLQDQSLSSAITIRAIDRFGHVQTAAVPAANPKSFVQRYAVRGILILILVLVSLLVWRRFIPRIASRRGS